MRRRRSRYGIAWKYILEKIGETEAPWEVVSSHSERSRNRAIANAWAGVSRFCCRRRGSSAREIKAEGDQRIAWRRYISVVYTKVETPVRNEARSLQSLSIGSYEAPLWCLRAIVSSHRKFHLPRFFGNIPTLTTQSRSSRIFARAHLTEIMSVTYCMRYTPLRFVKNEEGRY